MALHRPISQNAITDQIFTSNGLDSALGDEKLIFSEKDLAHDNLTRSENPIRAMKSTEHFRLCSQFGGTYFPKFSATVNILNSDSEPRRKTYLDC